eukprot:CAMPEP_0170535946 /NCGR_PEP_ID=MMETSP0209-20121228/101876_1 /TAXON_ID=665100 ORGANISM="Litonotus pictus, Strain P1" /NCGR_SAMPLE_ID=MMETSP0209 /ASSEMBLY_ACC=CAM_ASM_000301 /LENGTH=444 /DNA_ID=CAMNT_0010837259 /DNA_START=192 /DNA_END=1527 /DNA_ORIENTATION=-
MKNETLDHQLGKLKNLVKQLEKNKESLAQLITLEMGKTITESRAEIDRTNAIVDYYIENTKKFLEPKPMPDYGTFYNYVEHEPLGTVLHITPWNLPLAVPLKSIIPCLAAGNPCILKPAPNVPQTSLLLQECFIQAGFKDEFQLSFARTNDIDQHISDPRVRYVIFTGSTPAGRKIGELCGKNVKRSLLELGGSDPMLVLEDADAQKAIDHCVAGRIRANGQTCTSTKRVIVHDSLFDKVKNGLIEKLKAVPMGDPTKPETRLGPLARFDLFMKLNEQCKDYIEDYDYSIDMGNYFKPLIIDRPSVDSVAYKEELFGPTMSIFNRSTIDEMVELATTVDSVAYKEELFGPTMSIFNRSTIDEMVELANDTNYGLSASCISNDVEKAKEILKRIDSGMACVNTSFTTHSSVPFGGSKDSGFGRANSYFIFNEVTNMKSYTINKNL